MRNWLISYPRSGSTWLRYCVEFLSKRPTLGYYSKERTINNPIQSFVSIGVDLNKTPVLHKRHGFYNFDINDNVIFLVRNYKEAIIRHIKSIPKEDVKKIGIENIIEEQVDWYIELFNKFHYLKNKKIIIYYEDLIDKNLQKILSDIFKFLNLSDKNLNNLISNIDYHKKRSIQVYRVQFPSFTKGNKKIYHSNLFNKKYIDLIDKNINDKMQKECFNYLKRYKEI